jgi:hypothetical protein
MLILEMSSSDSIIDNTFGSLVLGGYDLNRLDDPVIDFPMPSGLGQDTLEVSVDSIVVGFGDGSSQTVGVDSNQNPTTFNAVIDSTYPFLYLPQATCNKFQQVLGLNFDNKTGLYTLNDTQRANNLANIDHISFVISDSSSHKATTSIQLPYVAFDLNATWPIYDTAQHYFPIRPSSTTTNVLGRAVLQEMYIIADYDHQNFTIAKAALHQTGITQVISISNSTTSATNHGSSKLSTGAIVGIVIGAVAGVLIICLIAWLLYRKRQTKKEQLEEDKAFELAEEAKHDRRHTVETVTSQYSGATELDSGRPVHKRHVSELSSDSNEDGHARVVNPPGVIYELDDPSTVIDPDKKTDTSAWQDNQATFAANELAALRGKTPGERSGASSASPEMGRPSPLTPRGRTPIPAEPSTLSPTAEEDNLYGPNANESTSEHPSPP